MLATVLYKPKVVVLYNICKICKKKFRAKMWWQKTCKNDSCQRARAYKTTKEWKSKKENLNYDRDRSRFYRKKANLKEEI